MPIDPNETPEQLRERLRKTKLTSKKDLFDSDKSDFDETQLASGSSDLLKKSDAELFPDEIEEYTPEERRQKIIGDNKLKDDIESD